MAAPPLRVFNGLETGREGDQRPASPGDHHPIVAAPFGAAPAGETMTKDALRKSFKSARQSFVSSKKKKEMIALVEEAGARLEQRLPLPPVIAGYMALDDEPDPAPLLEKWAKAGHEIALPRLADRNADLEFRKGTGKLEKGPFADILQPGPRAKVLAPDMVLVPVVAVDVHGNRLGQGAGHYDRALAALRQAKPVTVIALAWERQIANTLPTDPWDQPVDYILTPKRLIEAHR